MSSTRARALAVVTAAVLGWIAALGAPRDFGVGHFVDDAHYVTLAKALREQRAYRTINLPDAPAETKYPPGYPALLALAWSPERSDAANLDALRWVNVALLGSVAAALAALLVALFGVHPAVGAAVPVIGLLHPRTAALWTVPLSEPLALLLVASGLVLTARDRGRLGTVALLAATYVRSLSAAFLLAAVIVRWRRRDPRIAGDAVLAALGLLPWVVWQLVHRSAVPEALYGLYGSYGAWYLDGMARDWVTMAFRVPAENAWAVLRELGGRLVGRGWLPGLVVAAMGGAVGWRLWAVRARAPVATLGLLVYGAVVLLWPFPPDRFIAAIWPLILVLLAGSLSRHAAWVALLALAVAGPAYAGGGAVYYHRNRADGAEAVMAQVRRHVSADAVLATTNPGLHYLSLGNRTVPSQRMRSYRSYRLGFWSTAWGLGDDLWAIVERYRPDYLVVERRGTEGRYALGSLLRQCPALFEQIWESPGGEYLFRVRRDVRCTPTVTER